MLLDDVTIEVRNLSLGLIGVVDLGQATGVELVKRFGEVGAWKLTLPNDYWLCSELKAAGSGIVVYFYDQVFTSGPMLSWSNVRSTEDPDGATSFVGCDDLVCLSDRLAYPTPSTADVTQQTDAYDSRSGPGETVLKGYVSANLGPTAPTERRVAGLTIGEDRARGEQVSFTARFQQVGEVLSTVGATARLGFDVLQLGGELVFDVYSPRDRSRQVVMDIENDLLEKDESSVSAPKMTRGIVGGQGDLTARTFVEVSDDLSLEAEQVWGRRIERFIDYTNADDTSQMTQTGLNAIEKDGRTILSLKITPASLDTMRLGRDWYVGDTITVAVDDQGLKDTVTEAIVKIDDDVVRIGATVGDPTGYDWESQLVSRLRAVERRLGQIEKN